MRIGFFCRISINIRRDYFFNQSIILLLYVLVNLTNTYPARAGRTDKNTSGQYKIENRYEKTRNYPLCNHARI